MKSTIAASISEQMQAHAKEFLVRWDGKGETAYPSTFVADAQGKIRLASVSHEHGDRMGAAAFLRLLDGAK